MLIWNSGPTPESMGDQSPMDWVTNIIKNPTRSVKAKQTKRIDRLPLFVVWETALLGRGLRTICSCDWYVQHTHSLQHKFKVTLITLHGSFWQLQKKKNICNLRSKYFIYNFQPMTIHLKYPSCTVYIRKKS